MDILYLLIPMSVVLVLLIVAVFGWAINSGQLDDLEREGERILDEESQGVDGDQAMNKVIP
ncbi:MULTISPECIES: cbb3-type cytochrome oxidase assembly protein CcoS [Roseateles]|uniref:Cbb3-type cytochrome oxidase assembly protein CcoS n=1 Tax=Roseateles flavus TaxID=3149041 RepID=A0ABV0GHV3_9BURK|nr:cbb3-type cytochrome oxidase assembly protein CcoS [Pelomonas sp. BJYL3]